MGLFDNNPCKGCLDRHPGCHGKCEKHEAWLAKYHEGKKKYNEDRDQRLAVYDVLHESSMRRKSRLHIKEKER